MMNQGLRERYYKLKGMFLELKEAMEQNKLEFMGLGISHGAVHFDNFKLEINSEKMEEILLRLYYLNNEVACINIEKKDTFEFYFDEVAVDFIEAA